MNERPSSIEDQAGPCGIVCGSCPLGSGTVAETAGQTKRNITDFQIPSWSPFVPGGEAIDWAEVDRALTWMETYSRCAGCENGGGPPECTIRICTQEKGYDLCSSCEELEDCTRFDWLGEHGQQIKERLLECSGLSKGEYIKRMKPQMPWQV